MQIHKTYVIIILLSFIIIVSGCSHTTIINTDTTIKPNIQQEDIITSHLSKNENTIEEKIETENNIITKQKIYLTEQDTNTTTDYIEEKKEITKITEENIAYIAMYIEEKSYYVPYQENMSVENAMKTIQIISSTPFSFKTKNYPGMGSFVYEINGKKQNNINGIYWIYSINGKKSTLGISQYIIQPEDIITWTYEKDES